MSQLSTDGKTISEIFNQQLETLKISKLTICRHQLYLRSYLECLESFRRPTGSNIFTQQLFPGKKKCTKFYPSSAVFEDCPKSFGYILWHSNYGLLTEKPVSLGKISTEFATYWNKLSEKQRGAN